MGKKFGRILFVGTGGGNDVFSATLAAEALWRLGWRWRQASLAGVVSPFHRHETSSTDMEGVGLTRSSSRRFLLRRDMPREIPFIDAKVAAMVERESIFGLDRIYALSVAGGSAGLTRELHGLVEAGHDYVVLVDLGGDIFYSGRRDAHVLSPMFDAMILRGFVDSCVPGILFEAGPGTDGELSPESLRESFANAHAQGYQLEKAAVDRWQALYQRWIEPHRPGRTVPMTIKAFASAEPEITMAYRARAQLGRQRWYAHHDQRIATDLCRQFFLVDPRNIRNPFAVSSRSVWEWFLGTQHKQHWTNNEASLQYLPVGDELLQLLTPSPLFSEHERQRMIDAALTENLSGEVCDGHLVHLSDWLFSIAGFWKGLYGSRLVDEMVEVRPLERP